MPASPNLSHRIREEVDEIYTFPIKHDNLSYDRENSTVLVNHEKDGTATVVLRDPPARHGYYENYSNVTEEDPTDRAEHELANDLVETAERLLVEHDPQTSHWKANSGNRSLSDIYVRVDEQNVDEVILKMWQLLIEFRVKYIEYLKKYEPEELVSPTAPLKEKVEEIAGGLNRPHDGDLG